MPFTFEKLIVYQKAVAFAVQIARMRSGLIQGLEQRQLC